VKQIVAILIALLVVNCSRERMAPDTQIFILVDLSATWHNAVQDQRNSAVLVELGHGVAGASEEMEPPINVQVRAIGSASLEREPLCNVTFQPRLTRQKDGPANEVSRRQQLESYLARDCPSHVLAGPPENQTEITSAIESIAAQPAAGARRRVMVLVSDFLEDTAAPVSLDADIRGFDVLMLYRPVQEDQVRPADMRARVLEWEQALSARGARVTKIPDTGLNRRTVASYLLGEF
jgi:hypothetical protein